MLLMAGIEPAGVSASYPLSVYKYFLDSEDLIEILIGLFDQSN